VTARDTDWDGVRLHVITGKGGTGKTTVAAALALALATGGRKTLLVEIEGRQGIAQLFDCPPLPYEERKVAAAPGGGDVFALPLDAEEAFLEYLDMYYHLSRAGRVLRRFGAIDFATTVAPGLRDVLLTGKVYEAVRRKSGGWHSYDAVVMDAPPTGRIRRFLNVNSEVAGLAKMGPIRHQADSIMRMLRSPQTAVHIVTLLEEMPVQEAIDGAAELAEATLPVGGVVINMVQPPILRPADLAVAGAGQLDPLEVTKGLLAAGIDPDEATIAGLLAEASERAARISLERSERTALAALDRPMYELPALAEGVDLGALYELAAILRDQGAA
jgi:anion-transporting  ArsA/GET3 family ATPase